MNLVPVYQQPPCPFKFIHSCLLMIKLDEFTDVLDEGFWLFSIIAVHHYIMYTTGFAQIMIVPEWSNNKCISGPEPWCWESCWVPKVPLPLKGNNSIYSNLCTKLVWILMVYNRCWQFRTLCLQRLLFGCCSQMEVQWELWLSLKYHPLMVPAQSSWNSCHQ